MSVPKTAEKARLFIRRENLLQPGDTILVAVSGGSDSMVLLHFLLQEGYHLAIAHVNFQLRGDESDADTKLVEWFAREKGIVCHTHRLSAAHYSAMNGCSIEEAARQIRYSFFYHLCAAHGYQKIVTAHHANDNLETTILHLTRGSGIKGLSGIPMVNHIVVRPFLELTRDEIRHWAITDNVPFRDDGSNQEIVYSRNLIRHQVVPVLKQLNPSLENTFLRNNRLIREAEWLASKSLDQLSRKICRRSGNDIFIHKSSLLSLPAAWSLLFHILEPYGFRSQQCEQITESLNGSGKWFESGNMRLIIDRNHLILTPLIGNHFPWIYIQSHEKSASLPGWKIELSVSNYVRIAQYDQPLTTYLDLNKIQFPLLVRPWQKGDYFYPSGLYKKGSGKPAKKKVSDLLINAKKSMIEKERTLIMLSGDHIVWVMGNRVDERFIVTDNTRQVLKIQMLPVKESICY